MALPTLLDIVKVNSGDAVAGLIDETTKAHPEVAVIPARTIKGISYETTVRTGLGRTTGSFRLPNEGTSPIKSQYKLRKVDTYILDARVEADKAVADRSEDGPAAYMAMEASGVMEGEMQGVSSQFYYGAPNNAAGYPGLIQAYDPVNFVVDAGGTTANTGSSVWFVRTGPKDVIWVWGMGGQFAVSPPRIETILDPNDPTKKLTAYVQTLLAYPGVQVGSVRSVCRIKKLTADNGKGLTDKLIAQALSLFPAGLGPDLILMTQRSMAQLQQSRTATTPTGVPALFPSSFIGIDGKEIPIKVTAAISNTEALTL